MAGRADINYDELYHGEGDEDHEGGQNHLSDNKQILNSFQNQSQSDQLLQRKQEGSFGDTDQNNTRINKSSTPSRSKHPNLPYARMSHEDKNSNTEEKTPQRIMDRLSQARNELKNLRQSVQGLRSQHKKDVSHLEGLLQYSSPSQSSACSRPGRPGTGPAAPSGSSTKTAGAGSAGASATNSSGSSSESAQLNEDKTQQPRMDPLFQNWKPIGYMESSYLHKSGTPRQGCLVQESRGLIRILDALYSNPHHSLHGLDQYSHVWLLFAFDQNSKEPGGAHVHTKAKVAPPRLGGAKLGVFATRSPHRPNPIGLTLAKLEKVEGSTVHVSGIDILFGTAILDIKPYIPEYDAPPNLPAVSRQQIMRGVTRSHDAMDEADETAPMDAASLDGSYVAPNVKDALAKPVSPRTVPSKGIVITKLKSTSNYDHILAKVADLKTSSKAGIDPEAIASSNDCSDSNSSCSRLSGRGWPKQPVLSTKQQLRNAENEHDAVTKMQEELANDSEESGSQGAVKTAKWLQEAGSKQLEVIFNPIAEQQILCFSQDSEDERYRLSYVSSSSALRELISSGVRSDPRSRYRRATCPDLLYHFTVDRVKVTAVFLEDLVVEVLRVLPAQGDSLPPPAVADTAGGSATDASGNYSPSSSVPVDDGKGGCDGNQSSSARENSLSDGVENGCAVSADNGAFTGASNGAHAALLCDTLP